MTFLFVLFFFDFLFLTIVASFLNRKKVSLNQIFGGYNTYSYLLLTNYF